MDAARKTEPARSGSGLVDARGKPVRTVQSKRGEEFAEVPAGQLSCKDATSFFRDACSCASLSDLPIVQWLPRYSLGILRSDLIAGLSVGVLLIPQSMGYSLLAGLPPIYGLYSSTVPLIVYALLASSTKVSLGPVAPSAILINGIIISAAANKNDPAELATLASGVAFCCGLIQIVMGLLRFGFVAQLLSWPVMSGYLAGAAVTIVASQLRDFFGVTIPSDVEDRLFYERVVNFFTYIETASLPTTLISLGCLFVLVGFKYLPACGLWRPVCRRTCGPKPPAWIPLQLLVVVATIGIAVGLGVTLQDNKGVAVVGTIPPGFPTPAFPIKDGETFFRLLPQSLVLAVIAYVGTISIGISFARKDNEEVSPNMELLASGAGCLVGSMFQGFVVAGSFTRTAVNANIGAKTPMAVVFTALLIILTLLFISPVFELLPKAALAAMVIASCQSLIKPVEFLDFWRRKRTDAFQTALTFIFTLWLGVDWGIIAAVGVALVILVLRSFKPRITELGSLRESDVFVDRARYPDAKMVPGVIVYRVDAQARVRGGGSDSPRRAGTGPSHRRRGSSKARLDAEREAMLASGVLRAVVVDCVRVSGVDLTACRELQDIVGSYADKGICLLFAALPGPSRDVMERFGVMKPLDDALGTHSRFITVAAAVESVVPRRAWGDVPTPRGAESV